MPSAQVDLVGDVATLPLQHGQLKDGRDVWFVITDTNDQMEAERRGLVHAGQLLGARDAASTRTATIDAQGNFTFDRGTVDFRPPLELVPADSPSPFPPKVEHAGSIADLEYSPFVRLEGSDTLYNAPIVAFDVPARQISFCNGGVDHSLVHDQVIRICPEKMDVTLRLGHGFAAGQPVIYLSFEGSDPLAAALGGLTYAPALKDLRNSETSENIFAIANGQTGRDNPERQGLDSALLGEGPPLNILDGLTPKSQGYTPLWDLQIAKWSDEAITRVARHRLIDTTEIRAAAAAQLLTGFSGGPLISEGIFVNCPVIGFLAHSREDARPSP